MQFKSIIIAAIFATSAMANAFPEENAALKSIEGTCEKTRRAGVCQTSEGSKPCNGGSPCKESGHKCTYKGPGKTNCS